jgi:hypothetical protein
MGLLVWSNFSGPYAEFSVGKTPKSVRDRRSVHTRVIRVIEPLAFHAVAPRR